MLQEYIERLSLPSMSLYREVYRNSERWNGDDPLEGKQVIVFGEAGDGDMIHFSRYIPLLLQRQCQVMFHCPTRLHRLFEQFGITMLDAEQTDLPPHDYHIPSMSLPFVLNQTDVKLPYLNGTQVDLGYNGTKVGIAWEGNPQHSNNDERSCPLRYFKKLVSPDRRFYVTKGVIHSTELIEGAEDFDLYGWPIKDYQDTADLLSSVDYVVSVDTSVVHIAGAIGKKIYLLLSYRCDPRWAVKEWYDNMTIIRQTKPDDWGTVMETLADLLEG